MDIDHVCARNPIVDDKTALDDDRTLSSTAGSGPCGGAAAAAKEDGYLFNAGDDEMQREYDTTHHKSGMVATDDVYDDDDRTGRVVFVDIALHDDMDGDDAEVDDVYPSTDSVFDGGDDATMPDDDVDPVQAGSDDRFESPLFVTAHTEDVDLDAAMAAAAHSVLEVNEVPAPASAAKPCGGNLRGAASGPGEAHPVEDYFVFKATVALQSFLRSAPSSA